MHEGHNNIGLYDPGYARGFMMIKSYELSK